MCVGVYLALTFDIDTDNVHLAALAARVYNAAHTQITLALDMRHRDRVHTMHESCYQISTRVMRTPNTLT